jgi:hypothetical protein
MRRAWSHAGVFDNGEAISIPFWMGSWGMETQFGERQGRADNHYRNRSQ